MARYVCMQDVPDELYRDEAAKVNEMVEAIFDQHLEARGLTKNTPWVITWAQGFPVSYENGYPPLKWLRVQLVIHVLWRVRYLRKRVGDPRTFHTYRNWLGRGFTDVTPPEEDENGKV